MTNFIGKSTHPVQVKKVQIRIWSLRDEIEAAIAERLKEEEHSEENPIDINDIKEFYQKIMNPTATSSSEEDSDEEQDDENLDPSGNPMDDDAAAMLAAMGGGEDAEATAEGEEKTEEDKSEEADAEDKAEDEKTDAQETEQTEGEKSEEEQADKDESAGDEDDEEAARLAAEMLADQGGASASNKDDEKVAQPKKERGPFERVVPPESKIANGYVLLADIFMDQILLFCDKTFMIGQNLVIEFLVTEPFSVTAELVVSQDIGRNSKIIKEIKYGYRLQSIFLFQFPGERGKLRQFLQSVEPEIPAPPKKSKKSESDDDDEFDDLGF